MTRWMLMIALCACQAAPRTPNTPNTPNPPSTVGELAARRTQVIAWLRDYYEAGTYPTDDAGRPLSVFRDAQGVRCPMAEVIYRSGHADLVDAVARENNQVRLADVHAGPLHDWMLGSGLTGDEIAMVQGAMELDTTWLEPSGESTILARGQVRGRLETAVRALRDNTAQSLAIAAAQLPARRLPIIAAVTGQVLPEAALHSTAPAPLAPALSARIDRMRPILRSN